MSMSEADRLILEVAAGVRRLTPEELQRVLEHVAEAGFDPNAQEQARGRVAGLEWRGGILRGSDRLPPVEVHYLWHVVRNREWPEGTTLEGYVESIRHVVLDATSGVFASHYQDAWQLGVVRGSREWRGPAEFPWVLVEYRVDRGHWVTAFQPREGLGALRSPYRRDIRWLRRPKSTSGRRSF